MSTLDDWIADTCRALGLPDDAITNERRDELLDLTRDVARGVARIAGPLTTYLVGMAVGGGMSPAAAIGHVAELAAAHAPTEGDGGADGGDGARRDAHGGDGAGRDGHGGDGARRDARGGDGAGRDGRSGDWAGRDERSEARRDGRPVGPDAGPREARRHHGPPA